MDSLIIDIETRINEELVRDVVYEGQDISPEEALIKYQAELKEKSGSDFLPVIFHEPIVIGYVHVGENYKIKKLGTFARGDEGIRKFWEVVNKGMRLVTWNGRAFDLPVLEMASWRLWVQAPEYYNKKFGARYRYSDEGHYDLYDFATNSGVVYFRGGLNVISRMIGLRGKTGTVRGKDVHQAYKDGRIEEIENYCVGDILITTGVYYHIEYTRGRMSLDEYKKVRGELEEKINER